MFPAVSQSVCIVCISRSSALKTCCPGLCQLSLPACRHASPTPFHGHELRQPFTALAAAAMAARGRAAPRGQPYQNTPLQLIALPTDTVEVTDPTHPWYGFTFPLLGITTKPRL